MNTVYDLTRMSTREQNRNKYKKTAFEKIFSDKRVFFAVLTLVVIIVAVAMVSIF